MLFKINSINLVFVMNHWSSFRKIRSYNKTLPNDHLWFQAESKALTKKLTYFLESEY